MHWKCFVFLVIRGVVSTDIIGRELYAFYLSGGHCLRGIAVHFRMRPTTNYLISCRVSYVICR
ncbi:hypothetical protein M3J09_011523 [Ascochyta lentis]